MPLEYPNSNHNQAHVEPEAHGPIEGAVVLDYPEMEKPLPTGTQALDQLTPELREIRESSERKTYSAQRTFEKDIQDHPADSEAERALRAEFREQAADLGLGGPEVRQLAQLVNTELREGIPTDETVARWGRQSLEDVRRQYGAQADARLAAANRLVKRDPGLARMLKNTGLGSHPDVVKLLVEKAWSQRAAGKLK